MSTDSDRPATTPLVSARMSRQKRRDTVPEVALRKVLHARGLRFRLGVKVPGRPRRTIDIALPRARLAIFVDGCFWHGCPEHATWPRDNAEWWKAKLEGNRTRDRDTDAHLRSSGWLVLRIWEHEDVESAADAVSAALERRRAETEPGGGSP